MHGLHSVADGAIAPKLFMVFGALMILLNPSIAFGASYDVDEKAVFESATMEEATCALPGAHGDKVVDGDNDSDTNSIPTGSDLNQIMANMQHHNFARTCIHKWGIMICPMGRGGDCVARCQLKSFPPTGKHTNAAPSSPLSPKTANAAISVARNPFSDIAKLTAPNLPPFLSYSFTPETPPPISA
jgi:hypothetical protein